MGLDNTLRKYDQALNTLGRSGLNLAYPNEFELYVCAFELVNSSGETISYFIFPVMPHTMNERIPQVNNIKVTNNGITTLSNPKYIPTSITIAGNFGRKFKFLLNGQSGKEFASGFLDNAGKVTQNSLEKGLQNAFDNNIKTGYACTKILESIVNTSRQLDEKGNGYTLIFHNLAFDRVQIVKVQELTVTQDQGSNMIWNYNLSMDSLGDARNYTKTKDSKGMRTLQGSAFSQKAIGNVLDKVSRLFNKIL